MNSKHRYAIKYQELSKKLKHLSEKIEENKGNLIYRIWLNYIFGKIRAKLIKMDRSIPTKSHHNEKYI